MVSFLYIAIHFYRKECIVLKVLNYIKINETSNGVNVFFVNSLINISDYIDIVRRIVFIVKGITIISHIWSYYFWLFANIYTLEICRLQYFVVIKTDPPLWHDIMQQYIKTYFTYNL